MTSFPRSPVCEPPLRKAIERRRPVAMAPEAAAGFFRG